MHSKTCIEGKIQETRTTKFSSTMRREGYRLISITQSCNKSRTWSKSYVPLFVTLLTLSSLHFILFTKILNSFQKRKKKIKNGLTGISSRRNRTVKMKRKKKKNVWLKILFHPFHSLTVLGISPISRQRSLCLDGTVSPDQVGLGRLYWYIWAYIPDLRHQIYP